MKYVFIIVFNLIALYILGTFIFGNGGTLANLDNIRRLNEMQYEKYSKYIELENMRHRLNYLRSKKYPDVNLLAKNGRKLDNTLIFKFDYKNKQVDIAPKQMEILQHYATAKSQVFLLLGIVIGLIILGNILLLYKMETVR